jgi:hypothetical protein
MNDAKGDSMISDTHKTIRSISSDFSKADLILTSGLQGNFSLITNKGDSVESKHEKRH